MNEIEILSSAILAADGSSEALNNNCKPGYEQGLKHYRNHYLWSLIDTLANNFPTVLKALSENNFNFFARRFVLQNNSASENIDDFGDGFATFIAQQQELMNLPSISPLAQIDALLMNRFDNSYVKQIDLPGGSLALWKAINEHTDINNSELDDQQLETIALKVEDDEFYLVLV